MEMLITTVIFGVVTTMVGELVASNAMANAKLNNKIDGLSTARFGVEKICSDVRAARGFGDLYAATGLRHKFPDSIHNPFFTGITQSGTWRQKWPPPAPLPSTFELGNQCLIVQQSALFLDSRNDPLNQLQYDSGAAQNRLNGLPTMLDSAAPGTGLNFNTENLETVIYMLVPDTRRTGEYLLQRIFLPGVDVPQTSCTNMQLREIFVPQTVVSGIVGPIDQASGQPIIFRYVAQQLSGSIPEIVSESQIANKLSIINGVLIDMEIRKPDASSLSTSQLAQSQDVQFTQRTAIHVEAYKRSRKSIVLSR